MSYFKLVLELGAEPKKRTGLLSAFSKGGAKGGKSAPAASAADGSEAGSDAGGSVVSGGRGKKGGSSR